MPTPNTTSTLICRTAITAVNGQVTEPLPVRLKYNWWARPSILIAFDNISLQYCDLLKNFKGISIKLENGINLRAATVNLGVAATTISGTLNVLEDTVSLPVNDHQVNCLHFDVVNFPYFQTSEPLHQTCVDMTLGAWKLRMEPKQKSIAEPFKNADNSIEFAVTHACHLTRVDNKSFSVQKALRLQDAWCKFLSFARNGRCGTVNIKAEDENGKCVWELWGTPRTTPLTRDTPGWFDQNHGELLSEVFSGFWQLFESDDWEVCQVGLEWFLEALTIGTPYSQIPLIQCALERLAGIVTVTNSGPAAVRIKEALVRMGVNVDVPRKYEALEKYRKSALAAASTNKECRKWCDAISSLVSFRNSLVHDKVPVSSLEGDVLLQVSQLGLWYIELMLLYLFEHYGNYANRIENRWVGTVEPVPWT